MLEEIKIKKTSGVRVFFLVGDILKFWLFLGRKTTDLGKNILFSQHVGGKNKIKLKCQFFFPRREQFHFIGGLVAHRISQEWPYEHLGVVIDWQQY